MDKTAYHRDDVYIQNRDLFENIFKATLKKVLKYKKSGKVLEVGSSTGLLLSLFKDKGWEVTGIEPSTKSSSYAIKNGIKTIVSTFEEAKLDERYDVVILNHVLEHLIDPKNVIKKVYELLNQEGIVVINVPNAGSFSSKLLGAKWKHRLPEEHLWQFTYKNLEDLLHEHKFEVLEWEAKSGIWEFDNLLLELWQALTGMKKRFFEEILTAIPAWFISQAKLGTGLSIIARKY